MKKQFIWIICYSIRDFNSSNLIYDTKYEFEHFTECLVKCKELNLNVNGIKFFIRSCYK